MLFWHLGGTIAIARYAFRDERMDLRFLALGALLPDLIDKPIAYFVFERYHATRLWGHTLLFASLLMVAVLLLTRRGRPRRRWMAVTVGVLIHLILDFSWAAPETLVWPFLGWDFTTVPADEGGYITAVLSDPWRWVQELAGLAYLVVLGRRADLGSAEQRTRLLRTGQIDVPIGR